MTEQDASQSGTDNTSQASPAPAEPAAAEAQANELALSQTSTRLNKKWWLKMAAIAAVAIGLGLYFLVDGAVMYPNRGKEAAEFMEYSYLDVLEKDSSRGGLTSHTGIPDPAARLEQILERERTQGKLDEVEQAQKTWLENLKIVNKLVPEATAIPRTNYKDGVSVESAQGRLDELRKRWTTGSGEKKKSPSPLSAFDIPSQWIGMVVSLVTGFWILVVMLKSKGKVFKWDRAARRVTMPTGESFVPEDIEEIDKRKWDKLYVTFKFRKEHPTLGGKSIEFDLLRYEPLEAWLIDMEKTAFPDQA